MKMRRVTWIMGPQARWRGGRWQSQSRPAPTSGELSQWPLYKPALAAEASATSGKPGLKPVPTADHEVRPFMAFWSEIDRCRGELVRELHQYWDAKRDGSAMPARGEDRK